MTAVLPSRPDLTDAEPPARAERDRTTRTIHPPTDPTAHLGSVSMPIYLSSTFERSQGWDYSRVANPTRSALQTCLADLEGGTSATCTSSGMAAITLLMTTLCSAGDHVVLSDNVYGGTWDLFTETLRRWHIRWTTVDLTDPARLGAAIEPETVLVYAETPSNPLQKIIDIGAVAQITHRHGALLGIDSTFASPALQQPIKLGADVVVQSTTKYLGGHSDVIGGAVITADPELGARFEHAARVLGLIESPFDAWLVLRGVKTLDVRMQRVSATALRVAKALQDHPAVARVHYPGLSSHPGHEIAAGQMSAFGGVVGVEVVGDADDAAKVCRRTRLFIPAVSLGGVESLIEHPASMTHCTTAGTPLAVPDTLLRLSIGLEHPEDLIEDLDRALRCCHDDGPAPGAG